MLKHFCALQACPQGLYYWDQKKVGGKSGWVLPLPIPNREVKLTDADGTTFVGE